MNDAQRDEWFTLVSSVGLSMDHDDFTEDLIAIATEAIKYVPFFIHSQPSLTRSRKTRDGKQRFAVVDGEFGKCVFLNDVPTEELQKVLRTHKAFIKERFGSGDGKEAYVDAGDLGVSPDAYLKKTNGGTNGDAKSAALKAGAVPVNGHHVANGVSLTPF